MGGSRRGASRDYLTLFSVAVTSVLVLAFLIGAGAMLLVQREHVADERANHRCETSAPRGATGWTLGWNAETETYTCIYDRNGRRTGQTVQIRRGDL